MEFQDLKSDWKNARSAVKSEADLLNMTKLIKHPTLKKIRIKLISEMVFLLLFLVIYYDWFDGNKKPLYVHIFLVAGLLLYLVRDIVGFMAIVKPINGSNLKISANKYVARIKRVSIFSLISSLVYSISFIVYFTSVITFSKEKGFLLLGLVIVIFQLMLWSYRIWNKRIKSLMQQVKDFDDIEDN